MEDKFLNIILIVHYLAIIALVVFSLLGIIGEITHHLNEFYPVERKLILKEWKLLLEFSVTSGLYFGFMVTLMLYLWAMVLVTFLALTPIALVIWLGCENLIFKKIKIEDPFGKFPRKINHNC